MKFHNKYRLFKLQNSQTQISKSLVLFHHLLPFAHLFCFTALLLLNMSNEIYGASDFLVETLVKIQKNYFQLKAADYYAIIGNLLTFLCITVTLLRYKLTTNYDQIQQHTKLQNILITLSMCLFYISQISIYFVGWSFSKFFANQSLTLSLLKCIMPLLYFTYTNLDNQHTALYGWQTVPIILAITLDSNIAFYLFPIFSMVYLLFVRRLLTQKICIAVSLFMLIFVLMNSSALIDYNNSGTQQSPISFLCLGIALILASIIVAKMKDSFLLKNSQKLATTIFEAVCALKGQTPFNSLSFEQYYELYNNLHQLLFSKRQNLIGPQENLIQKDHKELTKQDFLKLLQAHLDKQCKDSTDQNTFNSILLVKVRRELNYPFNALVQDMFFIGQKLERAGNHNMHDFMDLFDLLIKKYGIFKNQDLQTSHALNLNILHENFEVETLQILDKITEFWNLNVKKEVQMEIIEQNFKEIFQQKEKIDKLFSKMKACESSKKQQMAMEILNSILNPYKVPKQSEYPSHAKQQTNNQTLSFVILENDMIKHTSKDFLKSMNKSNQLVYENVNKKQIFGDESCSFVDNLIKTTSIESQSSWVTVPVIYKKNCIKLKKIKILWCPSLEVQSKLMIKFTEDQTLAKNSFLIYHYQTDTIKYYNEAFIQTFCINEEKFAQRLNNEKIFFNEIFVSEGQELQEIKKCLKEGTKIKCRIYLNKFVEKGALQTFNVQIVASNSLSIAGEPAFCVLRVECFKDDKKYSGSSNTNTESRDNVLVNVQKVQALNQQSLMRKYENEEFFCKLPNLYEGTITQKQSQLQNESRMTYLKVMGLFFLGLVISLLAFWALENNFLQQRITEYRKGITSIQNTSQQYALLYQMYSVAIKRYYLQQFPEQSLIVQNVPAPIFQSMYTSIQQFFLDEFMKRYLTQMRKPPNSRIDYQINFESFSIKTNSEKTTLMDFAENFKNNILNDQIDFLLKNYDNFRQLTINYEAAFNFQQTLSNVVSHYETYYWILIAIAASFLLVLNLLLCKIESSIALVYGLVEKLQIRQIRDYLKDFGLRKKYLFNIFSRSEFTFAANQKKLNDGLSSYRFSNQSEVQTFEHIESDRKYEKISSNPDQSSVMMKKSIDVADESSQIRQKELIKNKKKLMSDGKIVIREPFIKKLFRKSPFFILMLILVAIFIYDRQLLAYERQGMVQIYQMNRQFYISLLHIKRQQVDASIIPAFRHYFKNNSIEDRYLRQKISLVAALPTKIYLEELASFEEDAFNILSSSLCDSGGTFKNDGIKPCESYLDGIVTKGFRLTIDKYFENGKKVAAQSLDQFGTYPCNKEKCPSYFQHLFVSIMMGETLRSLLKCLSESTQIAFGKMIDNCHFRTLLKLISLLILCALYGVYWRFMKSKCRKSLQFFTMIPKSIMCSLKMTITLRKTKFFQKIDMI